MLNKINKPDGEILGVAFAPDGRYVVSESDFVHHIMNKGADFVLDKNREGRKTVIMNETLQAATEPIDIPAWGHYWGIKRRVSMNYHTLLGSMKELGIDTENMPEWPK